MSEIRIPDNFCLDKTFKPYKPLPNVTGGVHSDSSTNAKHMTVLNPIMLNTHKSDTNSWASHNSQCKNPSLLKLLLLNSVNSLVFQTRKLN